MQTVDYSYTCDIVGSVSDLSQVIRSMTSTAVQNLVEIRPWEASGQIGEILTIFRFLFIIIFIHHDTW